MLARFCAAAAAECIGLHKSAECIALRQAGTVVPCLNATCFNTELVRESLLVQESSQDGAGA